MRLELALLLDEQDYHILLYSLGANGKSFKGTRAC